MRLGSPQSGRTSTLRHRVGGLRRRLSGAVRATTDRVRPPSKQVLVGKDGWLFLQRDSNDVIGQHTGAIRLSAQSRATWSSLLQARTKLQSKLDFAWEMAIAPDKETIYREFLPDAVRPSPRRPVHEILDEARALGAPVQYLEASLRAAAQRMETFSKRDTHWNQFGAFVAYTSIAERLAARGVGLRLLEEAEISWRRDDLMLDLGSKLRPPRSADFIRADLCQERAKIVLDNQIFVTGRVVIFEQPDSRLPSAVLFGESFALHTLLFLKESFRRLCFVHTSTMSEEIIAAEQPDVVISLPTERFMIAPPTTDEGALEELRDVAASKAARGEVMKHRDYMTVGMPVDGERAGAVVTGVIPWA
jgi:hypothetical protein